MKLSRIEIHLCVRIVRSREVFTKWWSFFLWRNTGHSHTSSGKWNHNSWPRPLSVINLVSCIVIHARFCVFITITHCNHSSCSTVRTLVEDYSNFKKLQYQSSCEIVEEFRLLFSYLLTTIKHRFYKVSTRK